MIDKTDIQRMTVSAIGAVALTAASVFIAAAPVRAEAAPLSVAGWQASVQNQLNGAQDRLVLASTGAEKARKAVVAVRFTADGDYAGAQLAQSSGNAAVDRQALRVAGSVNYPALPAGYRGTPQEVTMRLYFGSEAQVAKAAQRDGRVTLAFNSIGGAGAKIAAR